MSTQRKKPKEFSKLLFMKILFVLIVIIAAFFLFVYDSGNYTSMIVINPDGSIMEKRIELKNAADSVGQKLLTDILPFDHLFGKNDESLVYENEPEIPVVKQVNEETIKPPTSPENTAQTVNYENVRGIKTMAELKGKLYTIDNSAYVYEDDLNIDRLLEYDTSVDLTGSKPKILIFHTHGSEDFIDSKPGELSDTITGVGAYLAEILANDYGISVIHDMGKYDMLDSSVSREDSYSRMSNGISKILKKYPTVEIVIDLHRDGVPSNVHLVTDIDGTSTAKIMYFNGICRLNTDGEPEELSELPNPFVSENLAFSLNMQLKTNELYPGLSRKIYIKPYRYSLYFRERSLLVEAGANTNTVSEAKNLMPLLAKTLNEVVTK